MSYASTLLRNGIFRLLIWQALIIALIGIGVLLSYGIYYALAILYGGVIAMLVATLLGWRMQKISAARFKSINFSMLHLYLGAMERFILVGVGMGAGMGWLRLPPFPIIIGFSVAQLGYLFKLPDRLTNNRPR